MQPITRRALIRSGLAYCAIAPWLKTLIAGANTGQLEPLIGIFMLGLGYVFSYLLNDDRIRLRRPTLESTLRQYGILSQ